MINRDRINALVIRIHKAIRDEFPEEVHAAAHLFMVASMKHILQFKTKAELKAWEDEVLQHAEGLEDDAEVDEAPRN